MRSQPYGSRMPRRLVITPVFSPMVRSPSKKRACSILQQRLAGVNRQRVKAELLFSVVHRFLPRR